MFPAGFRASHHACWGRRSDQLSQVAARPSDEPGRPFPAVVDAAGGDPLDPLPPPSVPREGFGAAKGGKKRTKGDFRGIKLSNDTHRSNTDPDALVARRSIPHPALPSYRVHVLTDNRHDLIVDCRITPANGYGERDAAKAMAADLAGAHQKSIGADKNYGCDDPDTSPAEQIRWGRRMAHRLLQREGWAV